MKKLLFILLIGSLLMGSDRVKDNKALLTELKDCAMYVIDQHQDLINKNKDGTMKDKGLTKEWIGQQSFILYSSLSKNTYWAMPKLKNSYDSNQLGYALTAFLSSIRIVVAHVQDDINIDSDGTINPKNFYPAVFGRLTADEFKKRTGIIIKQTTTGKGYGPRNPKYNTPDAWEKNALSKLETHSAEYKNGVGESVTINNEKYYRYMYPLTIKKDCLKCHGDPKGETDISGKIKEGYHLGELRGGISILIPEN